MAAVDLPAPSAGRPADLPVPVPVPGRVVVDVGAGRGCALWICDAGLACCAVEVAAALSRLGSPGSGGSGGSAGSAGMAEVNVFVVAGTVTDKLAPLVLAAYRQVPEPKLVLSFGACSNSGGPYWDSYCVTKGVDQLIPVDGYVPGCPPRPEALLAGLDLVLPQARA
jgi:NADH-quinone oxidoreductase subunit B